MAAPLFAQSPTPPAQKTEPHALRALAVVQFVNSKPVKLQPVIIFVNGNFEDATLYQAGPIPLALQPGTVYEAQRSGVPQGLFTIEQPEQQKADWYAKGSWTSQSQIAAAEAAKVAEAKAKEAKKPRPLILEKDERPVLRHGGSESAPAPASSAPPPSLPSPPTPNTSTSKQQPSTSSGAKPSVAASGTDAGSNSSNADVQAAEAQAPGRPVLRRRGAKGEQVSQTEKASRATASKTPPTAASERSSTSTGIGGTRSASEWLVAVSDAAPSDQRPYKFPWTPEQQATITNKMSGMALRELQTYLRGKGLVFADDKTLASAKQSAPRAGNSTGARNSAVVKNWQGLDLRAFDLYYDNDAELVLTAERTVRRAGASLAASSRSAAKEGAAIAEGPMKAYVTLVAFMDSSNQLHRCKVEVTDDTRLDAQGKLELLDAVDATGDTRGELLFRRSGRGSNNYELYRVYPDTVYKLFDSAQPVR